MSWLSSLFGARGGDGVIRLGLPPKEHALALAWIRSVDADLSQPALMEAVAEWIEERVDDPFRARLRRALGEESLELDIVPRRNAPEPPMEALRRFSEEGWEDRLGLATHVVAARAACDPSWPPVAAWLAHCAASGIARSANGLVMDPAIPRFLPRAGAGERVPGDGRWLLSDHVVVSFSPEREGRGWLTTLGLSRFTLPEIELRRVREEDAARASWLAQAVALRVVDRAIQAPTDEDDDLRVLEMDAELALRPRDVAAARGDEADDAGGFVRPALVALRFRSARRGMGFLTIEAPSGSSPFDEWLRGVLDVVVVGLD